MNSTLFKLTWATVPMFNIAKYCFMTYFVGLLWDIAYVRAIETKRYLFLWYHGTFQVSSCGRSRNNLFSGSNFENISAAFRQFRPCLASSHPRTLSSQRRASSFEGGSSLQDKPPSQEAVTPFTPDSLSLSRAAPAQPAFDKITSTKKTVHGVCIEMVILVLILVVVAAEALSENYTDSVENVTFFYANVTTPVRRYTSAVIFRPGDNYSAESDLLFIRRCPKHHRDHTTVMTPNFVVRKGQFDHHHNVIPSYNKSIMCLYDGTSASAVKVKHTPIEAQREPSDLDNSKAQTFTNDDVQHRYYDLKVRKAVPQPHFSNDAVSSVDLQQLEDRMRFLTGLYLVDINNSTYSCTMQNVWCVRVVDDDYEIIYPLYMRSGSDSSRREEFFLKNSTTGFIGVMPIRLSQSTLPLLLSDKQMMRPARQGRMVEDIEDNLNMVAIGYNFGWTTQEVENRTAIVGKESRIVPTIQVGYAVSISTILFCSSLILFFNVVGSRSRKVTGLVGERAFIDRWHDYLARDRASESTHEKTRIGIVHAGGGVCRLQPPNGENAIPLSATEQMTGTFSTNL